jgi:hypothetical protein
MSDKQQPSHALGACTTSVIVALTSFKYAITRSPERITLNKSEQLVRRRLVVLILLLSVLSAGLPAAHYSGGIANAASSAANVGLQKQTAPSNIGGTGKKAEVDQAAALCGAPADSAPVAGSKPVITALSDRYCNTEHLMLGLDDDLGVGLSQAGAVDASTFVLFLNGREAISAGGNATYDQFHKRLIFHLQRDPANVAAWTRILGAPTALHQPVSVALGVATKETPHPQPSIVGKDGAEPSFDFRMISAWRLTIAILVIGAILALVWGNARRTAILKDNLVPQIEPARQPYSLGRWQMAFWFSLIIAAYLFLFILLDDYNTISQQALVLMGISGATAFAAIEIDVKKDSPADAANRGLRLLGINSWDDVLRIRAEIADRQQQLGSTTAPPSTTTQAQLAAEILDRQFKLRTYEGAIAPFVTQRWFRDLVTDLNGTALHRLQVFCWTWVLGGIFLYGVWRDLAMPNFSSTLLALMGISSAGYVGFKYPEVQD